MNDLAKRFEMVVAEREAVYKRVLELERQVYEMTEALKKCDNACDFCIHNAQNAPCEESDYLCDNCPHKCPCKSCHDNSCWKWRGS